MQRQEKMGEDNVRKLRSKTCQISGKYHEILVTEAPRYVKFWTRCRGGARKAPR